MATSKTNQRAFHDLPLMQVMYILDGCTAAEHEDISAIVGTLYEKFCRKHPPLRETTKVVPFSRKTSDIKRPA